MGHTTQTISPQYHQPNGLTERSIQIVKRTLNKAKRNSEDHFLAMLSLNSQPDHNRTSPAEKLFCHKLRTTLPLLTPSTQSVATKKHTVTQNLRSKPPKIAPGTTVQIRTDKRDGQKRYGCESK